MARPAQVRNPTEMTGRRLAALRGRISGFGMAAVGRKLPKTTARGSNLPASFKASRGAIDFASRKVASDRRRRQTALRGPVGDSTDPGAESARRIRAMEFFEYYVWKTVGLLSWPSFTVYGGACAVSRRTAQKTEPCSPPRPALLAKQLSQQVRFPRGRQVDYCRCLSTAARSQYSPA